MWVTRQANSLGRLCRGLELVAPPRPSPNPSTLSQRPPGRVIRDSQDLLYLILVQVKLSPLAEDSQPIVSPVKPDNPIE